MQYRYSAVPVLNEDGSYASAFGWDNPVASVSIYENLVTTNRVTGNLFGKFEIVPGILWKSSVGLDAFLLKENVYEPSALQSSNSGTAQVAQTQDLRWLMEHTLNFQKNMRRHSLIAVLR